MKSAKRGIGCCLRRLVAARGLNDGQAVAKSKIDELKVVQVGS